jgi:hydrogenase maturation protease
LILGIGNPHRGDDAAGVLVARGLRDSGIPAREHGGEMFSLLEQWSGSDDVILIDAVVTGAPAGCITEWDAATAPIVTGLLRCSTHAFGVAEAIGMARALDRLPPRLWIYGIEGASFDPGSAPSPEVLEAVEILARRLALRLHHNETFGGFPCMRPAS